MAQREYDVFISFKESDEDKSKTEDYFIAKRLYEFLSEKGLSVFFSPVTLESLGKAQYSKVIDDALDTVETLIVVGCSKEHLESKWVRYEWDSFLNDIRSGTKPYAEVFVLYSDMSLGDLPRALRQQQAFNTKESSAFDKLFSFLSNHEAILDKIKMKPPTEPRVSDRPPSGYRGIYDEYAVYYTDELIKKFGMEHLDIETELENLALQTMDGLRDHDDWLGDPEQWAENHLKSPDTTRILVHDGKIVGYYYFLFLEKEHIESMKNGTMSDSDITPDKIVCTDWPGEYSCYFMDIAVFPEHRFGGKPGAKILLDDFESQIKKYAANDTFISELCACAFTTYGETWCKKFGMQAVEDNQADETIYSIKLLPFPKEGEVTRRFKKLKTLYNNYYEENY